MIIGKRRHHRLASLFASFVVIGVGLVGCGNASSRPTTPHPSQVDAESSARASKSTTSGADEKKTPAAVALDGAEKAIRGKDYPTAAKKIDEARRLLASPSSSTSAPEVMNRAVYLETSLHAYKGDYESAARVLVEHLKTTSTHLDQPTAFYEHNWLSIVRQAQGDLLGALVEADARTRFGEAASWPSPPNSPPDGENSRVMQTKLKETWHRAYLLRMYAQQQVASNSRKEAALTYADEARRAYTTLAHPLGTYEDSIAVLDAFFAMHDGDMPRARAAAKRVDITKNDDVEDLYLVYSALDAAGDKEAAAAVRKRIEGVTYVSFVVPIIRSWIEHDGEAGAKRWSPRNPTGQP